MFELGQSLPNCDVRDMSAHHPLADITACAAIGRSAPLADIPAWHSVVFDHLVVDRVSATSHSNSCGALPLEPKFKRHCATPSRSCWLPEYLHRLFEQA